MTTITLHPKAPYDLALSGTLMQQYHGVLDHHHNGVCYRAVQINGQNSLLRAQSCSTVDAPCITVEAIAPNPIDAHVLHTTASHIFSTDDDFTHFYTTAKQHPALWRVVQPLNGLHHFRSETVFEALMLVIIEQQISLYAALRAQRALVEWGNESIIHNGHTHYRFPSPEKIANAPHDDLHNILKITHRRVDVMQQIAQNIENEPFNLESLRGKSPEEAYAHLMSIKGIGHWTAAWTLIRGLGIYTYAAHNDVALRDATANLLHNQTERISADQTAHTFAQFAPDAGLAAFYVLMRWAQLHY